MLGVGILLTALTMILLVISWIIGWLFGMPLIIMGVFFIMAVIINIISYWYSDKIVLRMYKAKPSHNEHLKSIVKKIAQNAKIPMPKVYEVPLDVPNAFATGRNPQHAAVAVTHGLLRLDQDELEGVLAHEIGHIRNRDMLLFAMAATIAGAIAYLAQIGYWSMFMGGGNRRGEASLLGFILIVIFAPIAAFLIRMAISRKREYRADETGALLTKNPGALASALRKISEIAKHNPIKTGSSASAHMFIVNPFKGDWFTGLFATHPPMQKRVERLERINLRGVHHE